MRFDNTLKPELVCSTDETRYNLTDPYLDVAEKKLVATDGHRLVAVPVEVAAGEASRFIGRQLLDATRQVERGNIEIVGDTMKDGPGWPTNQTRTFPRWQDVVPQKKEGDPGTVTIFLDAHYLRSLALALGAKETVNGDCQIALTACISDPRGPLSVRRYRRDAVIGAVALMMPLAPDGVVLVPEGPAEPAAPVAPPEQARG